MTNLKTIAKIAGVSPSTVSRILSGKNKRVNKKVEKILEIAEKLGYRKNLVAQSIRTGKTYIIGVIVSDISYSFYPEIVRGIEDELSKKNYAMILYNSLEDPEKEKKALHNLVERQVEGVIISPIIEDVNEKYFWELKEKGIPFVVIDRYYPYVNCDFVGVNDREGAYKAVKYLIECGHEKIGMVTGPLNTYTGLERFNGYKEALLEYGIKIDKRYIVEGIYGSFEEVVKVGREKTEELISKADEITAIFYGTDTLAVGGMKYLEEKGIRVPEDISIIGFADLMEARIVSPPLTTVQQPKYQLGKEAAKLLLRRIEEKEKGIISKKEKIILETKIIIRKTVKNKKEVKL